MALIIFFTIPIYADNSYPDLINEANFKGEKLTLDFDNIDIRDLIQTLADSSGLNILTSEEITGTITIKLHDVKWDAALEFVLITKGLEKYQDGNIIWVFPLGKIKQYQQQKREIQQNLENTDELVTEYIHINYGRAEDYRNLLRGQDSKGYGGCGIQQSQSQNSASVPQANVQSMILPSAVPSASINPTGTVVAPVSPSERFILISPRGSVVVEQRTNLLIIRETQERINDIKKLISKIDVPVRQVVIESRLVIANKSFAKQLGVKFGVANTDVKSTSTNSPVTPSSQVINQAVSTLALSNPYGQIGMVLVKSANLALSAELTALQNKGEGKTLSNPRLMTSDRCQAKISQGYEVPFQSSSGLSGTNTQFKEAVLELDVMPQITPMGGVTLVLNIKKNEIDTSLSVNGQPSLITRNLSTTVHVKDGETLVLGGIHESTNSNLNNQVPWFVDLPVIGWLFDRSSLSDDNQELTIFITPTVVNS